MTPYERQAFVVGLGKELVMDNQVIRDPAVKDVNLYRVIFNDRLCSPHFNSEGAAQAYLDIISRGKRKPEYSTRVQPQQENRRHQ